MGRHILIVSQYFHPEPFRITDMAREWVRRGHRVTVLTGIPNYPSGRFYRGYGLFRRRREVLDGVEIIRIPLLPRGKSAVGMVLNYLSFVLSGFFWKTFTRLRADLVFTFEVSPMTQALVGVWYAKRRRIPHYIYVQDLWPENVETVAGIRSRAVIAPIERMVGYIYKRSTRILATSPSFVEAIRERLPEGEREKVFYLPQYAEDFYRPIPRETVPELNEDGRFRIIFTGNIGEAQGLDVLPRAAAALAARGERGIAFVIVGDGRHKDALTAEAERLGVSDLFLLLGRQPAERIPVLSAACDAAFLSFMDDPLFEKTIPAKLQSYLACGMPILAAASGETARIIAEADCGITTPIGDAERLADSILEMKRLWERGELSHLAARARAYFEAHFDKAMLMNRLDGLLSL